MTTDTNTKHTHTKVLHTPGPWEFCAGMATIDHKVGDGYLQICEITHNNGVHRCGADKQTARANAHLIAAAPDMLEALRYCEQAFKLQLDDIADGNITGNPEVPSYNLKKVRQVIHRAEGRVE